MLEVVWDLKCLDAFYSEKKDGTPTSATKKGGGH
jgi:hypothetical protein